MNRRDALLALLAAGAAPLVVEAQQADKVWRVGFLQALPSANDPRIEAFWQKLRELAHVEGKTFVIDYVSAEAKYERLPALGADLVRHKGIGELIRPRIRKGLPARRNGVHEPAPDRAQCRLC